jgi:hypothetical protein
MTTRRRPLGLAVCDRCGLDCRHSELRKEWSGVYVCPKCFETKHPALTPRRIPGGEPRPLLHARPPVRLVVDVDAIDIRTWWPHTAGGLVDDLTPVPLSVLAAESGVGLEDETGTDLELE